MQKAKMSIENTPRLASVKNWKSIWSNRLTELISDLETFVVNKANGAPLDIGKEPKTLSEIQGKFAGLFTLDKETWHSMLSYPQFNELACTKLIYNELILGKILSI